MAVGHTTSRSAVTNHIAAEALSRIDIDTPAWKTLVVLASAETDLGPDLIWRTWMNIEDWPSMSSLVTTARWTRGQPWRVGSEFVQELRMGFPFRGKTSNERVVSVEPGMAAEWGSDSQRSRTVHLWRFEPLEAGGVRITNVKVFHGSFVGAVKPLVAKRWQRRFRAQVDGLINFARESA